MFGSTFFVSISCCVADLDACLESQRETAGLHVQEVAYFAGMSPALRERLTNLFLYAALLTSCVQGPLNTV